MKPRPLLNAPKTRTPDMDAVRQYNQKPVRDPLSPLAVLPASHLTRCPHCERLMKRRTLWGHVGECEG